MAHYKVQLAKEGGKVITEEEYEEIIRAKRQMNKDELESTKELYKKSKLN